MKRYFFLVCFVAEEVVLHSTDLAGLLNMHEPELEGNTQQGEVNEVPQPLARMFWMSVLNWQLGSYLNRDTDTSVIDVLGDLCGLSALFQT